MRRVPRAKPHLERRRPKALHLYTCPMHPEVVQDHPGDCPKCGMTLEPMSPADESDDHEAKEMRSLLRRFWIGLALTIPVLVIAIGGMVPSWHFLDFVPRAISKWIEFALATPVVLWAGWNFFVKAWRSLVHRSPNMFTLIGVGVGAAYLFSAVEVIAPGLFPDSFRSYGEVGLYFEAAAVITVLVLLGKLLEAKARSRTGQAIQALLSLAAKTAHRLRNDQEENFSCVPRKVGGDTLLSPIIHMVSEAQRSRAPIQKLADTVAGYFVPAVILIALVTFVVWAVWDRTRRWPSPSSMLSRSSSSPAPVSLGERLVGSGHLRRSPSWPAIHPERIINIPLSPDRHHHQRRPVLWPEWRFPRLRPSLRW